MAKQLQAPFTTKLPYPVYFRTVSLTEEGSYPRHRHPWGEFVYAFSGVMELKLAHSHYQHLGLSFTDWRQRLRVVKALAMLETGHAVESIALDLGYSSASAFIAMFRRMTGTTPDKVRGQGFVAS
jgi:methylphosphotriester-DNA--protein-cysteine methyltransferase